MKHARLPRHVTSLGITGALALAVAFGPAAGTRAGAQSQPPPPPVPNGTPAPFQSAPAATPLPSGAPVPTATATAAPSPAATGSPEPRGRHRRGKETAPAPDATGNPEPTATPTSPAFATLDGTWEVQVQYINRTEYSHLVIQQNGTGTLSGTWRDKGKDYPFEGSYDGRLIRMVVKEPAVSVTLSGYVEGASDMVGTVAVPGVPGDPTAFTAEHRGASTTLAKKKR